MMLLASKSVKERQQRRDYFALCNSRSNLRDIERNFLSLSPPQKIVFGQISSRAIIFPQLHHMLPHAVTPRFSTHLA